MGGGPRRAEPRCEPRRCVTRTRSPAPAPRQSPPEPRPTGRRSPQTAPSGLREYARARIKETPRRGDPATAIESLAIVAAPPNRPTLAVFDTKPYDRAFLDVGERRRRRRGRPGLPAALPRGRARAPPPRRSPPAARPCAASSTTASTPSRCACWRPAARSWSRCAAPASTTSTSPPPRAPGITVVRVPAYSPHAVAEHTLALILALDRKIHRAWNRVREGNFALDGLMGRELHGRTAGVVGTGEIGAVVAKILAAGFGANVLAYDPRENPAVTAVGGRYVPLETLLAEAEIVTLHCPLTARDAPPDPERAAGADARRRAAGEHGPRRADRRARSWSRRSRAASSAASPWTCTRRRTASSAATTRSEIIADDVFARLLTFPNVVITGHQAFFTRAGAARDRRDDRGQREALGAGRGGGARGTGIRIALAARALLAWSSGKDSAWTLHVLRQRPDVEVVGLADDDQRRRSTASRCTPCAASCWRRRPRRVGLPLCTVDDSLRRAPTRVRGGDGGGDGRGRAATASRHVAFGDLFLEDVRRYREDRLAGTRADAAVPALGHADRRCSRARWSPRACARA